MTFGCAIGRVGVHAAAHLDEYVARLQEYTACGVVILVGLGMLFPATVGPLSAVE